MSEENEDTDVSQTWDKTDGQQGSFMLHVAHTHHFFSRNNRPFGADLCLRDAGQMLQYRRKLPGALLTMRNLKILWPWCVYSEVVIGVTPINRDVTCISGWQKREYFHSRQNLWMSFLVIFLFFSTNPCYWVHVCVCVYVKLFFELLTNLKCFKWQPLIEFSFRNCFTVTDIIKLEAHQMGPEKCCFKSPFQ